MKKNKDNNSSLVYLFYIPRRKYSVKFETSSKFQEKSFDVWPYMVRQYL